MEWFEKWFGEEYAKVYSHRDQAEAIEQIEFLKKELPLNNTKTALDIACGNGRQAILLSEIIDEVWGLDLSEDLLKIAKDKIKANNSKLKVVQGDMRKLPFNDSHFDLITNFFTGFGYFKTDQEHRSLLKEWARVCKKNAFFLLDYLNREHIIETLEPFSQNETDEFIIEQSRKITEDETRVEKEIVITEKKNLNKNKYKESVRMYSFDEINIMLKEAGFKTLKAYGSFKGEKFEASSNRLIVISQIS